MQFSQVIGHERLKEKLIRTASMGRVSHAQLFLGAEGRGALALATAYAQYLNCENPTDSDSCGTCHNCRKYAILQHPDLHFSLPVNWSKSTPPPTSDNFTKEWKDFFTANTYPTLAKWYDCIDIENKQGIINAAEAENIIRTLNYKAYEGKYKVLIMWHAEQMRVEAANKLLKLIEEPPANTVLLLLAQNTDAMLKTIISRTQQVLVPPIAIESIAEALAAQKGIPQAAALEYARLSNGDYAEALGMTEPNSSSEDFWNKFAQLMRICMGNKEENVIALLMWADDTCKKFGREAQKQFLIFALRMIRESFLLGQSVDEAVGATDRIKEFAPYIHLGNAKALYEEFNLAQGHIAANGNARIIFTDLALKVIKRIHAKSV
jgi:DNA polymerase-3 subunit delta'